MAAPRLRLYDTLLKEHFAHNRQMAFVSGPRQVGKTTTCRLEGTDYLDWDNADDRKLLLRGPAAVAERLGVEQLRARARPPIAVLDELHKYARWKRFLKGFFDVYSVSGNSPAFFCFARRCGQSHSSFIALESNDGSEQAATGCGRDARDHGALRAERIDGGSLLSARRDQRVEFLPLAFEGGRGPDELPVIRQPGIPGREHGFIELGALPPAGERVELRLDLGGGVILQIARG